jgi:hypothetical protein
MICTYCEIGIGNPSIFSTEIESSRREIRIKGVRFSSLRVRTIYLRIWVGRRVAVIDWRGLSIRSKSRRSFKVVLGWRAS